jgi:hypothetical protein
VSDQSYSYFLLSDLIDVYRAYTKRHTERNWNILRCHKTWYNSARLCVPYIETDPGTLRHVRREVTSRDPSPHLPYGRLASCRIFLYYWHISWVWFNTFFRCSWCVTVFSSSPLHVTCIPNVNSALRTSDHEKLCSDCTDNTHVYRNGLDSCCLCPCDVSPIMSVTPRLLILAPWW